MATLENRYWMTSEEGNAARQLISEEEYLRRRQQERERILEENQRRRRLQVQARLHARYMAVRISLFIGVVAAFLMSYVYLQSSITSRMQELASVKSQIADLKAENSARQNRIDADSNLTNIKKKASEDLGMVYADSSRIMYYTMDDTEYMELY